MVKNLKGKKYLSNKMKENINIIDKLFESGFKISDSVNEYIFRSRWSTYKSLVLAATLGRKL